eukprot:m.10045 g.10045  ORF g.10045 m.10045 type:complete len:193 (-) comp3598_c0_seq1:884-1462(-)
MYSSSFSTSTYTHHIPHHTPSHTIPHHHIPSHTSSSSSHTQSPPSFFNFSKGGKLEKGETIEQAAIRELEEESHLTASKLEKMGRIFFEFVGDKTILEVHVFEATEWIGEPEETEEMDPKWFCVDNLPFESMWLDDKHWFPFLLSQQAFSGYFLFDGEYAIVKKILKGNDVDETFDTLRKEVDSEENQQSSS